ncbi:NUDIX hydrolase [Serratia grimesii]|uniref:NUDIX hydrolase n=1 Tax=Serratia grimesii TaxID=82995 RepID=UPI00223FCE3D|nr:NUDIX hydrolase [Serratia grimesii]
MKNEISSLLEGYKTSYAKEEEHKCNMLNILREQDNVFYEESKQGHFTASAWVLNHDKTKVLLTLHAKLNRWFQLGGHIEPTDLSFLDACLREAQEESGIQSIRADDAFVIDVDIHKIPENPKASAHLHYDITLCFVAGQNAEISMSKESKKLEWIPVNKVKDITDDLAVIRMAEKTLQLF